MHADVLDSADHIQLLSRRTLNSSIIS